MRVASCRTAVILETAEGLLAENGALMEERGVTLVGLSLSNLASAGVGQLDLAVDRLGGLDAALDRVRDRYGAAAITRAVLLGRNTGYEMPVLPD